VWPSFGAIANAVFGDAGTPGPEEITAGTAAVFIGVLAAAVAAGVAAFAMPRTPLVRSNVE
jgi:hypothetical protein